MIAQESDEEFQSFSWKKSLNHLRPRVYMRADQLCGG